MNKSENKLMAMVMHTEDTKQYCKYTQYIKMYVQIKKQLEVLDNMMCDMWVEREKIAQKVFKKDGTNLHVFDDCRNLKDFM